MDVYQNVPVAGTKPSPTSQTGELTAMNATMTSDWKSKLSPRGRGRIQVALPTDEDTTDFDQGSKQGVLAVGDMSIKKEFAQTGNFPARMKSFGLHSGDKNR